VKPEVRIIAIAPWPARHEKAFFSNLTDTQLDKIWADNQREEAIVLAHPTMYRINMEVDRILRRNPVYVVYNEQCEKCGAFQPDESLPYPYQESFIENDDTEGCSSCSLLWLILMTKLYFGEILRARSAPKAGGTDPGQSQTDNTGT